MCDHVDVHRGIAIDFRTFNSKSSTMSFAVHSGFAIPASIDGMIGGMKEQEFWLELRLRLNRASGLDLPGYCDWFEPKHYYLSGVSPRVTGSVGFVSGKKAIRWPFTLNLIEAAASVDQVNWEELLSEIDNEAAIETTGGLVIGRNRAYNVP
jgi:hypothetical protein